MAKYRCPTLGDCEKANSSEIFDRSPGEDLKCPACGTLLEPQMTSSASPSRNKTPLIAAGLFVVTSIAIGSYFYKQSSTAADEPVASAVQTEVPTVKAELVVASPAAIVQTVELASSNLSKTGIAPSDAETKELRLTSDANLVRGDAAEAESASSKAASNEMLKVAIAKMAQGKLDEAEKDLIEARTRAPKQSLVYYNMGILRLKQGRVEDALNEFESSFKTGFSHFDKMDEDSDLDGLRKNPRFIEIVAKYRSLPK